MSRTTMVWILVLMAGCAVHVAPREEMILDDPLGAGKADGRCEVPACPINFERSGDPGASAGDLCTWSLEATADGCGCSPGAGDGCDARVREGDCCVPREEPECDFGVPGAECNSGGESYAEGTRIESSLCVHGHWAYLPRECVLHRTACVATPGCGYCTRDSGVSECLEGSADGPFDDAAPCDDWQGARVTCGATI